MEAPVKSPSTVHPQQNPWEKGTCAPLGRVAQPQAGDWEVGLSSHLLVRGLKARLLASTTLTTSYGALLKS